MKRCAGPLKFLVVEDEPLISMDIEMMIADAGHQVIGTAATLDEVQAMSQEQELNVALVDLHLARGSSGFDVSDHIQMRWPGAIIVFVTANPSEIPEDFGGAHGVIAKPFSSAGFVSAMQYLKEGICDPPPVSPQPGSFVASKAFAASWGAN
ncbi:response regulator [Paracoccus laeviglucosivorans]|uniref:CheY chemotaxis protein or a CheY-like REC (Receiver) domain n=1 Tax=Paracoccus laeviglucosivorans TaxID=1197861 RepID=A0A521FQS8_9RHOB|nr:response regulator [Paracoccus laeviglucosivorans]SMO98548.1 CheY chemotaxis protein or a CheY-like REC (receiver) domain [Paracoccus laeviglucosivorans]